MHNTINGKPRTTDTGTVGAAGAAELPLLDFLRAHDVNPKLVAVAINGDVIPKTSYDTTVVREGDDLEIVRMVGGGAA
jgi:sulfur carrier protein